MKLYQSFTSPYARKVRVVIREKGLGGRVEEVEANPFEPSDALQGANPLHRLPALTLDEGEGIDGVMFDSPIICAYLEDLAPEPPLVGTGPERWRALRGEALSDGMLDAAFAIVMERRRPEAEQSKTWQDRWAGQIMRAADVAEAESSLREGPLSIGQIGLGVALGYLDFRLPDLGWREGRPVLAAWYEEFAKRPSMIDTQPPA